ncbi:hypothetical protein SEA_NEDARYA_41 [Gordonia phage Nedarya]|nr:hypothetical protein SEA_NEDARYA_41 [Gordonia phage Nedarya]
MAEIGTVTVKVEADLTRFYEQVDEMKAALMELELMFFPPRAIEGLPRPQEF